MKYTLVLISIALVTLTSINGFALELGQGRLYGGFLTADPTDLNTALSSQNVPKFTTLLRYGFEYDAGLLPVLNVGLRYVGLAQSNKNNGYTGELKQEGIEGVVRIPLIKNSLIFLDAFGSVGFMQTNVTVNGQSQSGEIQKNTLGPIKTGYGASAGIGFKGFYLFVEGGMENNKVDSLKTTGTFGTGVQNIDLSGSYVVGGLAIDASAITKK